MKIHGPSPEPPPERLHGSVIIEWPGPQPSGEIRGDQVRVLQAATGAQILTVASLDVIIRAEPGRPVTADLHLLTDKAGSPLIETAPGVFPHYRGPDGKPAHALYRVRVAEIRVRDE